jgi:CIC family chloride channel protein
LTEETAPRPRRLQLALGTRLRLFARNQIRNSDLGLAVTAVAVGALAAVAVALLNQAVRILHEVLFGIPLLAHLSGDVSIDPRRLLAVPLFGGLAYGLFATLLHRRRQADIVDAIEANALYGGRMSLSDSIRLAALTVFSAGVGASVGLEAAYTQLGAGMASRVGRALHLRRADVRTIVGCGAAAAIAAAFNAPLAGAFYAFELIIGSYTLSVLAPVAIAALAGTLVQRRLFGPEPIFFIFDPFALGWAEYVLLAVLGAAAGGIGIAAMRGVTLVEEWGRRLALRPWFRPAIGGAILGAIGLIYPQVLGSGHGGIVSTVSLRFDLFTLVALIAAKLIASAISIGSGFRGGMFSSSLFLGALFGSAFGGFAGRAFAWLPHDHTIFLLAGMGAVAAAIVGAPVTMIMLVLEATSNFYATIGVTVSVVVAWIVVRHWFGYSFATWRFHVRGVPVRGAHDIGWLHDLTVAKVMRRDAITISQEMRLREVRKRFPVGATKRVFVLDASGSYAGFIDIDEAHGADLDARCDELTAADIARGTSFFLVPQQLVRTALDLFVAAETETLVVVSDAQSKHVIGYLTEAYALRRYTRELEARRREEHGADEPVTGIHAPAQRK